MSGICSLRKKLKQTRGFTLIEAVMVLALVGILALITVPVIIGSLEASRLNAAAQKLLSDIRYVKELALSHHDVYGIELNATGNSYQLFKWDGVTKAYLTDPHEGGTLLIDYDLRSEFTGVTIASLDVCEGITCLTDEIRFSAFGVPSDADDVAFTSLAFINLARGSLTKAIQVTPETSFTEVV